MNHEKRRNPYVVLGIPFGASRDVAQLAFAKRAKRQRRGSAGAPLPDLTWALNQVDEVLKRPELAVEIFRIPADPAALEPTGIGVFAPPPEHLVRRTSDSEQARASVRQAAHSEATRHLGELVSGRIQIPAR